MRIIFRRLLLAISFLTILPIAGNYRFEKDDLSNSTVFFPFVGFLIGMFLFGIFYLLNLYLPLTVTVFIILVISTFITGGLHEDGLGDSFDGFGGGYTREKIFEIMKDSRIGTFGSLALIYLTLGRYVLLLELDPILIPKTILVAFVLSRWSVLPLLMLLKYPKRATGTGKAFIANIAGVSKIVFALSSIFTFFVVFLVFHFAGLYLITATVFLIIFSFFFFKRRINAITGDCAGAVLVISEVLTYFIVMIL